jgi:CspA family cold shock protein
MSLGKVTWYSPDKGYAFIQAGNADIHVHHSQLEKAGLQTLVPGQVVRFDLFTMAGGRPTAENLQLIGNPKNRVAQGVVRSFSSQGGYGFVTMPAGGEAFIHISQVEKAGLPTLERGQRVGFTLVDNPRGPAAENLSILST